MADALLGGFLEKKAFLKDNVVVSDICQDRLGYMSNKFGVSVTSDNTALCRGLKSMRVTLRP